jgi:hypothetical protein
MQIVLRYGAADGTGCDLKYPQKAITPQGIKMKKSIALCGWLLLGTLVPTGSHAGSIFLCRVYSGGSILSSARCDPTKAVVEREIYVPDSLSWDQQVAYAEQVLSASRALQNPPLVAHTNSVTTTTTSSFNGTGSQCKALDAEIAGYDAIARQPQSGQTQDWIAERKRAARTKQFGLHCP